MFPKSAARWLGWCLITMVATLVLVPLASAGTTTPVRLRINLKNPVIWQRFGNGLYMTETVTTLYSKCYYYNLDVKTSSVLMENLPHTAAPLGSQIKWLMYMDFKDGLDRLMAGDVDYDISHIAQQSNRNQVGCGMRGNTCIYGQYTDRRAGDRYAVDLYSLDIERGGTTSFLVSNSEKTQFAHDGNLMVYRAYYSATDVRICGVYFDGGDEFTIASRNGFEPSVCGPIVAWYEVNGAGYDIVAKNMETGEIRTIAYTTANPPRPEAGRGSVFWQDKRNAAVTGVDIYGYCWQTGQEFPVVTDTGDQHKLRVCDDLVTWMTGTTSQAMWIAYVLPPLKIGDLTPARVTGSSVTLGWTSVGETGDPSVEYDLRMRTDGPITDANWATSTPVPGMPVPQAAGQPESFAVEGLASGTRYFAIKARSQSGAWTALSDSVCAYVCDESIALSIAPEGTSISVTGIVSGIGADGQFYCQRMDRSRAVRVIPKAAQALPVGQQVTVTGKLSQDAALRGPVLLDAAVSVGSTEVVEPIGMLATSLGGFDARYGGTPEKGPSNLWLRVRVWGKVSYLTTTSGCSFYLNDGSKLSDNLGCGVWVTSRFAPPPGIADGKMVAVEGICRLSRTNGRQIEIVENTGITVF